MGTIVINPENARKFGLDIEGIREGLYTDQYFNNVRRVIESLAREGYTYGGSAPPVELDGLDPSDFAVGDAEVDLQVFTRRRPASIVAGVEVSLYVLASCTGYFDESGEFVNTAGRLSIRAVRDGSRVEPWRPVLRIAGRYRDFAVLETVILGILTRSSLIATNTYEILQAARGKPVFFFPARFDLYHTQPFDGLAYKTGVEAYNRDFGGEAPVLISTDAQGAFFGLRGTGTTSHSFLLCFLKDTTEAMLQFARVLPPEVKRVALVDVNNDCVGETRRVALAMFERYRRLLEEGRESEAEKFVLSGVRADTAREMRDVSVEPLGDPDLDCGVCARLIWKMRQALDSLADDEAVAPEWREKAREYFRSVKIIASGGFNAERTAALERVGAPVDSYGIGSWFFRGGVNDFTADVVRVRVGGRWYDLAKAGRKPIENPDLEKVVIAGTEKIG